MLLFLALPAFAYTGYYRTPDLAGDTVVFVAEGDLWTAPVSGGSARRLTSVPGDELLPRVSPDGKTVAFVGNYDGDSDIYVIPLGGGEPRRLTWNPDGETPVGFTPDGKQVIFRSHKDDPNGVWRLYTVPVEGGDATQVPLGWASWLDIDPSSGRWAFTRTTREFATWKRYRGGTAADIWVGDPKKQDFAQVTTFAGADAFPMWHDGRVYFLSDEGGSGNLWSMAPDGTDRKAVTAHHDWDARFPAMGADGRIVYMLAGDLWLYDPKTGKDAALAIDLPGERAEARTRLVDWMDNLSALDLSPDADRLLLTLRGQVWSVPVKPGPTLPVAQAPGVRESWGTYSDDGKRIFYFSDATGEEALMSADAWGRGDVKTVVAAGTSGWHFSPQVSPDGKLVAYADQAQTLWAVPAGGGTPRQVDHSDQAEIRRYVWSPDGRWLAYDKAERTDYWGVWVWDSQDGSTHRLSSVAASDYDPAWDPDGRYLYFTSDRNTNPVLGYKDMTWISANMTRPYAVVLQKTGTDPFAALSGLPAKDDAKADDKKKDKKKDKKSKDGDDADEKPPAVTIDFDGILDRVVPVPIAPTNVWGLAATKTRIYYTTSPITGMNEAMDGGSTLMSWDLEGHKEEHVLDGVLGFAVARNADKLLVVRTGGEFDVVDAGGEVDPGSLGDAAVDTSNLVLDIDLRAEWKQIYDEAWRLERDFFWAPNMSGLDWKKERDRYATLLDRLGTRSDLDDLIGELIGELGTSHTYVWGGDMGNEPEEVGVGLLGADTMREGSAFKVTKVYHGDPADNAPNPLSAPSAQVKEGEYVLAVNHQPFPAGRPFEAAFVGLADKPVVLTVATSAAGAGSRDVVVVPVGDDHRLRYVDWVRHNREYVAEKSGGKFGYVHIPDMGAAGLTAFDTWFEPQLDKEGLVVDCRWNRGGFVSQMILEHLRRTVLQYFFARNGGRNTWPDRTLNGPLVVLTNEFAGSDGDIFPQAVQNSKLGPVIGERSWGGVIGIRGDKPLVDGGFLSQPEYATWYPKKGWVVENHGVDPDIVVQNLPQDVARGVDTQLDRAIRELQQLHDQNPPVPSTPGPKPTKTRGDYEKTEGGK